MLRTRCHLIAYSCVLQPWPYLSGHFVVVCAALKIANARPACIRCSSACRIQSNGVRWWMLCKEWLKICAVFWPSSLRTPRRLLLPPPRHDPPLYSRLRQMHDNGQWFPIKDGLCVDVSEISLAECGDIGQRLVVLHALLRIMAVHIIVKLLSVPLLITNKRWLLLQMNVHSQLGQQTVVTGIDLVIVGTVLLPSWTYIGEERSEVGFKWFKIFRMTLVDRYGWSDRGLFFWKQRPNLVVTKTHKVLRTKSDVWIISDPVTWQFLFLATFYGELRHRWGLLFFRPLSCVHCQVMVTSGGGTEENYTIILLME